MTEATLISGPYGSERVPVPGVTDPGALPAGGAKLDGPPELLNDVRMEKQPGFDAAYAARMQNLYKPEATNLEAVGASVDQWVTSRVLRNLGRPSFAGDTPINQFEYLNELPLHLSPEERDYFISTGKGEKSAAYAVQQIEEQRTAQAAAGDHPITSMLTSFADPALLATGSVGNLAKFTGGGRLAAAAIGGAVQGGLTAAQAGPVSDKDIALGMIFGSAFSGMVYSPEVKKLVPADVDYPTTEIDNALKPLTQALVQPKSFGDNLRELAANLGVTVERDGSMSSAQGNKISIANLPENEFMAAHGSNADDVLAHELAHQIAGHTFEDGNALGRNTNIKDYPELRAELTKASQMFRPKAWEIAPEHTAKPEELYADGLAMWMRHPELRDQFPRISAIVNSVDDTGSLAKQFPQTKFWIPGLPKVLQPWAKPTNAGKLVEATDSQLAKQPQSLGDKLQWNMRKTMNDFGPVGKKVADLLYDNNSDLSLTSVEAHREAIMADLRQYQFKYEDRLRQANKDMNGFGTADMTNPFKSRAAYEGQNAIERDVQREMFRREQAVREGKPVVDPNVPQHVTEMADHLDELHKMALNELKASGVAGADGLESKAGYMTRKWSSLQIDRALDKLQATGITRDAAHEALSGMVGDSVAKASQGMRPEVAQKIGKAIINRALEKGYFDDAVLHMAASEGQLTELRSIMKGGGMSGTEIEEALDVLRNSENETGKASYLKHRMDLDYTSTIRAGDEGIGISDLIDNRVTTIVDQYVKGVSTQAAFARKGLVTASDTEALRTELLHSLGPGSREAAKDLFDNTMNYFRGNPAGAKMNDKFRLFSAYGRAITLAWSGLWQSTEFANMMGRYGLLRTVKYIGQEIGAEATRLMTNPTAAEARTLNHVLAENSTASMRLRPYLARYEDGFEMDTGHALQLSAQTAGQLVPMFNAMKFVHHFQANIVGNLITERLAAAAKGDLKARSMLQSYGIESQVMDKLALEIQAHGMEVDKWSDSVWGAVRPTFAKMMDESVLKSRLGDMPAFAHFDQVGKFIFTYRSFVIAAHNKVLAGGIARNGVGAVGLIALYQFPLTYAAVSAQNVIQGKTQTPAQTAANAMGQMGGLGLFSEPLKWATGQSNSVGSSGLIPADRAIKLLQAGVNLDPKGAGSAALSLLPVISAIPFLKAIPVQPKKEKK